MNKILEAAKKAGADIGTWDKSGNGINLVSFKESELKAYTLEIEKPLIEALKQARENIGWQEGKREYHRLIAVIDDAINNSFKA